MNKRQIVFLAPYPTPENIKEGMMQRVAAVDALFDNTHWEKIYLRPHFKSCRNTKREVAPDIWEYHLSIWTARRQIIRLLNQADIVYCHSLYGISVCGLLYWRSLRCPNTIWDVHGIIPEELSYAGSSRLKVALFSRLEHLVAHHVTKIVTVTDAMRNHLQKKYPQCKARFYTYAILPLTTTEAREPSSEPTSETVLLYSGNTQKYQNIPRMVQHIARLADQPGLRFEILTGSPEAMRSIFTPHGLGDAPNIHIHSVMPHELGKYYQQAHYGYALRDDIDVNNVACPTKVVEYLAYGIRPIVLQPSIGDFNSMGYEYVLLADATSSLPAAKSLKNYQLYRQLQLACAPESYLTFLLEP